jgi:ERCC4-type nuclease
MIIQYDTREKQRAIRKIINTFNKNGVQYFVSKLPVGDYMNLDNPRVYIDRKQNLQELCGNVCQQYKRFRAELERANQYGIKLIILCEHGKDIKCLEDIIKWENPRLKDSPLAVSGERLYKILYAMGKKYNVDYYFCTKAQTGNEIIRLLSEVKKEE